MFCRRRTGISPQTLLKRVPVGNTTPFLSGGHLPLMKNKVAWYPQEFLDMFSQKEKPLRRTLPPQPWDETHRPQTRANKKATKKSESHVLVFSIIRFVQKATASAHSVYIFLFKGTLHCKLAGPPMLCCAGRWGILRIPHCGGAGGRSAAPRPGNPALGKATTLKAILAGW